VLSWGEDGNLATRLFLENAGWVWGASGGRPAKAKSLGKVVACWAGWREKAAGPGYGIEEEGGLGRLLV
jgi:hypothetical protein